MKTVLRVENFSKTFGGGLVAVNDVSFAQTEGTIKAIIGPNGAGKSTLVKLIMGDFPRKDWKGKAYFEESEISELRKHQRVYLGMTETHQLVKLFKNMSVAENVMVGVHSRMKGNMIENMIRNPKTRREEEFAFAEARRCLQMVNLEHRAQDEIDSLPYGLQKLVEVARAMACKPRLLIMDEPAAGLNNFEVTELCGLITRIRDGGTTVLIIEHNMDLVMNLSDEIVVMNFGRKIAKGTSADVQSNEDVLRAYLGGKADFADN